VGRTGLVGPSKGYMACGHMLGAKEGPETPVLIFMGTPLLIFMGWRLRCKTLEGAPRLRTPILRARQLGLLG
jgi:hypothetical protein